jgi:FixJ family two-component response regulator
MKAGAVEFLTKPLRDQDLLDAIQAALRRDRARLEDDRKVAEFRTRLGSLTAREREVMALLVSGRVNKQIAAEAGISEVDGAVAPRSDHAKGARHFAGRPDPDRRQNQILMAGQGTEAKTGGRSKTGR